MNDMEGGRESARARDREPFDALCESLCPLAPAWGAFSFFFLPLVVVADAAGYLTTRLSNNTLSAPSICAPVKQWAEAWWGRG